MKGLLEEDKKLQLKALKGLIRASKALNIDATRYKNAIKALDIPKDEFENEKSFISSQPNVKSTSKHSIKKREKPFTKRAISLKKSVVKNGNLILTFNRSLSNNYIHKIVLKKRTNHLYVFQNFPNQKQK